VGCGALARFFLSPLAKQYFAEGGGMNFVITSTCMNRNDFLLKSLPSWLRMNVPVVIVDWSSTPALRDALKNHLEKITLVEVPGKEFYNSSRAKNLAFRIARSRFPNARHILNLDCDVIVNEPAYFLQRADGSEDCYYRGWKQYPGWGVSKLLRYASALTGREFSNMGLIGSFMMPASILDKVNGYDERMNGYGIFDSDLYERVGALGGIREKRIPRKVLHHQPHGDRVSNYSVKSITRAMQENRLLSKVRRWDGCFEQERQACLVNGESGRL
jgi:hypothetical protein